MIRLKSILLREGRIPPDFTATNRDLLNWRQFWFSKIRQQFFQAVHNWHRDGVISDENLDDYLKVIDDMGELLKATGRQANKLAGGGIGAQDFQED